MKNSSYPSKLPVTFEQSFTLLREAKDFIKQHGSLIIKHTKIGTRNHVVKYSGFSSNSITTGRKFYIIDEKFEVHHRIITMTRNITDKSISMIEGFSGEFINVGGLHADIMVDISIKHNDNVKMLIDALVLNEKQRYKEIEIKEKFDKRNMLVSMLLNNK